MRSANCRGMMMGTCASQPQQHGCYICCAVWKRGRLWVMHERLLPELLFRYGCCPRRTLGLRTPLLRTEVALSWFWWNDGFICAWKCCWTEGGTPRWLPSASGWLRHASKTWANSGPPKRPRASMAAHRNEKPGRRCLQRRGELGSLGIFVSLWRWATPGLPVDLTDPREVRGGAAASPRRPRRESRPAASAAQLATQSGLLIPTVTQMRAPRAHLSARRCGAGPKCSLWRQAPRSSTVGDAWAHGRAWNEQSRALG
jgi:hypothetical protein